MEPPIPAPLFAVLLFLGMLTLLETGRRLGVRRRSKESEGERGSLGAIEGAVFALFGLLMAFTFSGAASRFSEKRMLIAEEVNAVEVAYLRLELVAQEARPALPRSKKLQEEIWGGAVAATRLSGSHPAAGLLLLPALNNMIDIATTRAMALQTHPPGVVFVLLFCVIDLRQGMK